MRGQWLRSPSPAVPRSWRSTSLLRLRPVDARCLRRQRSDIGMPPFQPYVDSRHTRAPPPPVDFTADIRMLESRSNPTPSLPRGDSSTSKAICCTGRVSSIRESAPVAQLDRAPVFGTGGWGFESLRVYRALGYPGEREGIGGFSRHSRSSTDSVFPSIPPLSAVCCSAFCSDSS